MRPDVMLTWGVLQGHWKQTYNTETNRNLSRSFENCKLPFSRRETDQRERTLINSVATEGRVAAVYSEGFLDLSSAKILFSCKDPCVI